MQHHKKGAVLLLLLFATQAEAGGVGGMLKGLKQKLDTATQQSQPTPTQTTQDIAASPVEQYKQAQVQANNANPNVIPEAAAEADIPVTSATFDFKGIKLGMSVNEVFTIAKKNLSPNASQAICRAGKITIQHEEYVMGDELVICRDFQYFGQDISSLKAYFINGKLSHLIMGAFYSEGSHEQQFPAVFQALADKYSVKPTLNQEAKRAIGHDFASTIQDTAGNELFTSGDMRQDLSGTIHKNVVLGFQVKDYRQIQRQRLAQMDEHIAKEQQAETQRKQRDL